MLKWLKKLFQKKKNKGELNLYSCKNCVFWKVEEENNKDYISPYNRFCDINKKYTNMYSTCPHFLEERFEATPESTQTEEIEINHNLSIEREDENDTIFKQGPSK